METENLRSTEPRKNLTAADSVREEAWTDSLNPFKYVDKSIANYNFKKMTVGTGKEKKKITAGKSDWEKRLQPLKLDPIRAG